MRRRGILGRLGLAGALTLSGASACPAPVEPPRAHRLDDAPLEVCPGGGWRLSSAPDQDADGRFDEGAPVQTRHVCRTQLPLVRVQPTATTDCPHAVEVATGLDLDGNGRLADREVESAAIRCRGAAPVFRTTPVEDASCPDGGHRLASGLDLDLDTWLDDDEVTSTVLLCDGPADAPLRFRSRDPSPEACPAGGLLVQAGPDLDGDGLLSDDEVQEEFPVCGPEAVGGTGRTTAAVPGSLTVTTSGELERLWGIRSVDGDLVVDCGGLPIPHLRPLRHLERVEGLLRVTRCPRIADASDLRSLAHVGGLELTDLDALEDLRHLHGLSVDGPVVLEDAPRLCLDAFNAFRTSTGRVARDRAPRIGTDPSCRDRALPEPGR